METLGDLLFAFAYAATMSAQLEEIIHADEPARYILYDPGVGAITQCHHVQRGQTIFVHRALRLLVEPIDRVAQRHPMRYGGVWWVT